MNMTILINNRLCLLHMCSNVYDSTYSQAAALITHVLEYVLPLLPQTGMYIIGHALRHFGSAAKPTAEVK